VRERSTSRASIPSNETRTALAGAQVPAWLDARRLAEEAQAERVLIEPGDVHFADDSPPLNYFRLGISSIAPPAIREGVRRLGALIDRQKPRR
jgi:GntR family transcriptional regulator/MocR family aminotransferase